MSAGVSFQPRPGVDGSPLASEADTLFTQRYRDAYECVDACCVDLAIEALNEAKEQIESAVDAEGRDGRCYFARAVLAVLGEAGLMTRSAGPGTWQQLASPRWALSDCRKRCREGAARFPECAAMFDLIELARSGVVDFLRGKRTGVDVLFPKGDTAVWNRYNNENSLIQVYPKLAALGVVACAKDLSSLRILELGAGTGSGTAEILKAVSGRIARYTYSDLGTSFIRHGRNRFAGVACMDFQRLSIDESLSAQGLEPAHVDIVAGVNVVHAARCIESTLDHILHVLKPGGWLVLGEGSPPSLEKRWKPDLVFALLDGWWDVEITAGRPRPGFLMPHEWRRVLADAGFVDIQTLPGEGYFGHGDCYGGAVMGKRAS